MSGIPPSSDHALLLGRLVAAALELTPTEPGGRDLFDHLPATDWSRLIQRARAERVTGLLLAGVTRTDLHLEPSDRRAATDSHREAMAVALVLERLLLVTAARFRRQGIEPVVLKGPAVAHLDYPDPALRDFGDIDLLVPAEQLADAVAAVEQAGGHRPMPEVAAGWDRRFAKSITLVDASGYEIDLHRTVAPGVFGLRVDPVRLFERTEPFEVGGERFHALAPEGRLLQACLHTAAGNRAARLSSVADVALLGTAAVAGANDRGAACGPGSNPGQVAAADWLERFRAVTQDWTCEAAVERAVAIVRQRMAVDVSHLLDGLEVSDRDRVRLDRYTGGFAGPALTGLTALAARDRPAYIRALVWPSSASLDQRGLSRATHLRRLTAHVWSTRAAPDGPGGDR